MDSVSKIYVDLEEFYLMLNFLESVISEVCFFPLHKSDMSDFAKLQYADGNVTLQ